MFGLLTELPVMVSIFQTTVLHKNDQRNSINHPLCYTHNVFEEAQRKLGMALQGEARGPLHVCVCACVVEGPYENLHAQICSFKQTDLKFYLTSMNKRKASVPEISVLSKSHYRFIISMTNSIPFTKESMARSLCSITTHPGWAPSTCQVLQQSLWPRPRFCSQG